DVQGNDPWNPINPTNTFYQAGEKAVTWSRYTDVSEAVEVKTEWYEPNGSLYSSGEYTIPDPGVGYYYPEYKQWTWIWVEGHIAANKCGNWTLKKYEKDPWNNWDLLYEDSFQILESPNVNPQVSVEISPANPIEGQNITLQVTALDNTYLQNVILFWDDGTLHSQEWNNVYSGSFSESEDIGNYSEGQTIEVYARVFDTSGNQNETSHQVITILDSDTQGPEITNVTIQEYNGNSNGAIDIGEQIKISCSITDVSGISEVHFYVDTTEVTVNGSYYSICGPYDSGIHSVMITAADNDNTPAYTTVYNSFNVEEPYSGPVWHVSTTGSNTTGDGSLQNPFATIQHGIVTSSEGDTVLVQPGTYVENINYNGKNITVASKYLTTQDTSYISQTVIDGNNDDTVVEFSNGEDMTAILTGFTIRNGNANDGGGIYCYYNSDPSLVNVTISNNTANNGGGVYCRINSDPSFVNVTISSNTANDGGGIYCYYNSDPSLVNVTISSNTATNGGGIYCNNDSDPSLVNVTISSNTAINAGGTYCRYNSNPSLVNCILWNDNPQEIYFYDNGNSNTITIAYSDIKGGEAGIITNNSGTVIWLDGNIDTDPLFVYPSDGDYHITSNSPCIDAGDPTSPQDPDGTVSDMGAFYYDQSTLPPPTARNPIPTHNADSISIETDLSWTNGDYTEHIDLYFDTVNPPNVKVLDNLPVTSTYHPGTLDYATDYYWQVISKNSNGTSTGNIWHLITESNTGTILGTVTLSGGIGNVEDVQVTADTVTVNPDENGDYSLTINSGTYDVTAMLPGYVSQTIHDVTVIKDQITLDVDFVLNPSYSGPVWYVSTTGSNTTGDGSAQNPFATIQYGIDIADSGDTVQVAPGNYYENINIEDGVNVIGSGADVTSIIGHDNII
ncbi:MAG: carboxypeptidase regulatory-like domain-containing protein, partial [Candidatus Cloacimonetes bacterium]|nr:carboxypeptidase regulatory-like domain-containing protein [Candidatus Cloacimonadota bacterium]